METVWHHDELLPGRYVLYTGGTDVAGHFTRLEIWSDYTCIIRPTHKKHVGFISQWHPDLSLGGQAFALFYGPGGR